VANSIAFSAGALILLSFSHRSLKGLEGRSILATAGKASAATVPVLAVLLVFRRLWGQLWQTGSTGANLGILLAVGLVAVGIIGGLYWILRIEVVAILLKRRAK
jgi:hypothetical protein